MAESLKIAFFTDSFLPAHDGVVTSILNFRKELMKRGHEVYVFASGDTQTQRLTSKQKDIFIVKGMHLKRYPQYNLALLPFTSASKFDEINPDIVHSHTPFVMGTWALALAKMNKIPITSTFHTMFTDRAIIKEYASKSAVNFLEKYSWKYARFYYKKCNAVMVPSKSIQDLLDKKGIPNPYIVPNGIELEQVQCKSCQERHKEEASQEQGREDRALCRQAQQGEENRDATAWPQGISGMRTLGLSS